jgi:hypothetical protein
MTVHVTITETKTDHTLTWPSIDPEIADYINQTYEFTGKRVGMNLTMSGDESVKTFVQIWNTREDWDEYNADPNLIQWRNNIRSWQAAHRIEFNLHVIDID